MKQRQLRERRLLPTTLRNAHARGAYTTSLRTILRRLARRKKSTSRRRDGESFLVRHLAVRNNPRRIAYRVSPVAAVRNLAVVPTVAATYNKL